MRACGSDPSPRGIPSRSTAACVGRYTRKPWSYVKLLVPGIPRVAEGKFQPPSSCSSGPRALARRARLLLRFHVQLFLRPFNSHRAGRGVLPPSGSSVVLGLCEASLACRFSLSRHRFCAKIAPVLQFHWRFEAREQCRRQRHTQANFMPF